MRACSSFGEIIVGADLQSDDPIHLFAARGQHQDRRLSARAEDAAHLEPIDVGQHDVEDDGVERRAVERGEPVATGEAALDDEAGEFRDGVHQRHHHHDVEDERDGRDGGRRGEMLQVHAAHSSGVRKPDRALSRRRRDPVPEQNGSAKRLLPIYNVYRGRRWAISSGRPPVPVRTREVCVSSLGPASG